MNEQLNALPCGYFILNRDWEFVQINQTLKELLRIEDMPRHMHDILTTPSRVYFQTYFTPAISVHGKIREMYINLCTEGRSVPVLMNVSERNGLYEGITVEIKVRAEYEAQLLQAKKDAEKIQKETDIAYDKLLDLLQEVESKQKQLITLNNELQELATRDELTGLFNRRVFQKSLEAAIDRAESSGMHAFSLLLFDIDYFKQVNDTYGHQMGDEVLKELAQKLNFMIAAPHIAARIGGEEFAVIYDCADHQKNIEKAEQLRRYLEQSSWHSIPITVSMGISNFQQGDKANHIYVRADDAQYASKRGGRNQLTPV